MENIFVIIFNFFVCDFVYLFNKTCSTIYSADGAASDNKKSFSQEYQRKRTN